MRVRSSKISEGAHPIMRSCQTLWKVNLDLVWSPPAERCVGNTMAFESSAFRWCNFSMRVCSCGKEETPDEPFYDKSAVCRKCYYLKKEGTAKIYRDNQRIRDMYNRLDRDRRANPRFRSGFILKDSKQSDRRAGRSNDLTKEIIEKLISQECQYCGETSLKMTLDRRGNSLGHLESNVIPCCIRCNYIRRDMPYEAWILLSPFLRLVRESGLFGSWTCGVGNRTNGRDGVSGRPPAWKPGCP